MIVETDLVIIIVQFVLGFCIFSSGNILCGKFKILTSCVLAFLATSCGVIVSVIGLSLISRMAGDTLGALFIANGLCTVPLAVDIALMGYVKEDRE